MCTIGDYLWGKCLDLNLSAQQLANLLGINRKYFLRGKTKEIDREGEGSPDLSNILDMNLLP